MEKKKKTILKNDEHCAGCMLCMLSCSFRNFRIFNPDKSFVRLDKDERHTRFHLSIDDGCTLCGECIRACAYKALEWGDEDSHG